MTGMLQNGRQCILKKNIIKSAQNTGFMVIAKSSQIQVDIDNCYIYLYYCRKKQQCQLSVLRFWTFCISTVQCKQNIQNTFTFFFVSVDFKITNHTYIFFNQDFCTIYACSKHHNFIDIWYLYSEGFYSCILFSINCENASLFWLFFLSKL